MNCKACNQPLDRALESVKGIHYLCDPNPLPVQQDATHWELANEEPTPQYTPTNRFHILSMLPLVALFVGLGVFLAW